MASSSDGGNTWTTPVNAAEAGDRPRPLDEQLPDADADGIEPEIAARLHAHQHRLIVTDRGVQRLTVRGKQGVGLEHGGRIDF